MAEVLHPADKSSKIAFTLAEVLITLAIVGIVSVLVLPALTAKIRERILISQTLKAYNLLYQATDKMVQDEGTIDGWAANGPLRTARYQELLPKYLEVVEQCDNKVNWDKCPLKKHIKSTVKKQKDNWGYMPAWYNYVTALKNGMLIFIRDDSWSNCATDKQFTKGSTYLDSCTQMLVDVNGKKGPNRTDYDLFKFYLVKDGIIPAGGPKENIWTQEFREQCLGTYRSNADGFCAAWVIYNKNMDYLHCPENLGWNLDRSCK